VRAHLPEVLRGHSGPEARNVLREYLQARILESLQRAGAMIPLAFHGGTALRFLHSIRRYSEDLDFALERPEKSYDLRTYAGRIRSDLAREGYDIEITRLRVSRNVHSAFVKLPGLVHELGLSGHPEQAISVKLEVDTRPPEGAVTATTVVRRHVLLQLQHHDQASLLAGKLHAVLERAYPKGRDFYDLIWYLAAPDWPPPNLTLLNNALRQTAWEGPELDAANWRRIVADRVASVDWRRVVEDVAPFIEAEEELPLLERETLLTLLRA